MSKRKQKWIRTVYIFFIFVFIGWIGFSLISLKDGQRSSVSAVVPTPELKVEHKVKGDKLFLIFQLKHFELSPSKGNEKHVYGEGYIQLYIDGNKVAQIYKSAYVYSPLTPGRHTVKVLLINNNNESYGINEEFTINVPIVNEGKRIGE